MPLQTMTAPLPTSRRPSTISTDPVSPPRATTPLPLSTSEASIGSSSSSWTLQTPQSPSIMAVLHYSNEGEKESDRGTSESQELFEDTLPTQDLPPTSNGASNRTTTRSLHTSSLRDMLENGSGTKRPVPSTSDPDLYAFAQSQAGSGAIWPGRRLRPRLQPAFTSPLFVSRDLSISKLLETNHIIADSPENGLRGQEIQSSNQVVHSEKSKNKPEMNGRPEHIENTESTATKVRSPPVMLPLSNPIRPRRSIPTTLQRGLSTPNPLAPYVSGSTAVHLARPKRNYFDRMLPKELKVMIMKNVLDSGAEQERDRRWSGEVGARRELIKFSRVSKSWQALCLDGQLWANVDLTPFAAFIHPKTVRNIIRQSAPFISTLTLRGMSTLHVAELIAGLSESSSKCLFTNLTILDMRGYKDTDSSLIEAIIEQAPRLRTVNLRGVQVVDTRVLRTIAGFCHYTESLDISGCSAITTGGLWRFVDELSRDQAARIKVLRLGGLRAPRRDGHGRFALRYLFLKLVNLEVLDLRGCWEITDESFIEACETLSTKSRTSTIRHLVLSGCTLLRADIFPAMNDLFPELRYLELASMPQLFEENSKRDRTRFDTFLRSLPNLEKLDLDDTCNGGVLDDSVVRTLAKTSRLAELRIGSATHITPEAMVRFIRDCPTLRVFHADNTMANGAVMREFQQRHPEDGRLSLIDCRTITAADYARVTATSRPRDGFTGYSAIPMVYEPHEIQEKVVIKVFWSWRRVAVAKGWRDMLAAKEKELARPGEAGTSTGQRAMTRGRGKGWRKKDESYDDRGLCVVQ